MTSVSALSETAHVRVTAVLVEGFKEQQQTINHLKVQMRELEETTSRQQKQIEWLMSRIRSRDEEDSHRENDNGNFPDGR